MQIFSMEFGRGLNLGLPLTEGVNAVCPEEIVELRRFVELAVVELTSLTVIQIQFITFHQNEFKLFLVRSFF